MESTCILHQIPCVFWKMWPFTQKFWKSMPNFQWKLKKTSRKFVHFSMKQFWKVHQKQTIVKRVDLFSSIQTLYVNLKQCEKICNTDMVFWHFQNPKFLKWSSTTFTPKNSSSRTLQMLPPGLRQWTGKFVFGFLDSQKEMHHVTKIWNLSPSVAIGWLNKCWSK